METEIIWQEVEKTYQETLRRAYSTAPLDRPAMERCLGELYTLLGIGEAPPVTWAESPEAARRMLLAGGYTHDEIAAAAQIPERNISWVAFTAFGARLEPAGFTPQEMRLVELASELGYGGITWCFANGIVAAERACKIVVDASGALDCLDGPALAWLDGTAYYYVSGVAMTEQDVMHPESITLARVTEEANQETRRALMLLYGSSRYLRDTGAELIDSTGREKLYSLADGSKIMMARDGSTGHIYRIDAPVGAKTIEETQTALYGIPFANLLPRS